MISIDFFLWYCVFSCLAMFIAGMFVGIAFGRDLERTERARRDLAAADKMCVAIREYDDRVAEFAPAAVSNAQSLSQHERLPEALTTALASPASSALPCCEKCPCDHSTRL